MIKGLESVLLNSENQQALADFYKDKVGLKLTGEYEMGEDAEPAFMFELGNVQLAVLPHSEVTGKNPNPARIMLNIEVDNVESETQRLKDAGINCTQEIYHIEDYGHVATFEDVDGNYFQLVQVSATQ